MDLKTILAVAAILVGIILVFKDQLMAVIQNPIRTTIIPEAKNVKTIVTPSASLDELESLVYSLDSEKDKEELDFLIDKLAPKLIRRKLGR